MLPEWKIRNACIGIIKLVMNTKSSQQLKLEDCSQKKTEEQAQKSSLLSRWESKIACVEVKPKETRHNIYSQGKVRRIGRGNSWHSRLTILTCDSALWARFYKYSVASRMQIVIEESWSTFIFFLLICQAFFREA